MTKSVTHDYILHSHLRTYFKLSLALPELIIMSTTSTRRYLRIDEGKRIQIIALREQGYSLREISAMTKVVQRRVHLCYKSGISFTPYKSFPGRVDRQWLMIVPDGDKLEWLKVVTSRLFLNWLLLLHLMISSILVQELHVEWCMSRA